jgi:hypothetical protein
MKWTFLWAHSEIFPLMMINIPDILGKRYLFCDDKRLLSSTAIRTALRKLAGYLTYEGQPYVIAPHLFRHTIAQQMFALSKLMGHASPSACQYYVHSRQESLLKESLLEELDRLREKWDNLQHDEEQSDEEEQSSQEGEQQVEEQEGQEE